jgi:hypothetical protein
VVIRPPLVGSAAAGGGLTRIDRRDPQHEQRRPRQKERFRFHRKPPRLQLPTFRRGKSSGGGARNRYRYRAAMRMLLVGGSQRHLWSTMSGGPPPMPVPVQPLPSLWPQRLIVLVISAVPFVVACATPCLYVTSTNYGSQHWLGLYILVSGWTAFFVGQFAWFANCLLLLACVLFLYRRWLTTIIILLLALLIAMQTFMVLGQDLPADEGGVNRMHVTAIGTGFYFWLASFIVPIGGALWLRHRK